MTVTCSNRIGEIHWARLDRSPRLQRLMDALKDGRPRTTLDLILECNLAAVSASVSELRKNIEPYGFGIECRKIDKNRYEYRMVW